MKNCFAQIDRLTSIYLVVVLFSVFSIIVGGILNYSPVPFWDMWDGFLQFYIQLESSQWSAWWEQHNEHRIVLTRIIFWLSFVLFDGQSWFLIITNYLILLCIIITFLEILNSVTGRRFYWQGLFIIILLTSWGQRENLIWGFQSQFLLAQYLPILSFYLFSKIDSEQNKSSLYFYGSIAFGIGSIGTMANGILVLPLLVIYALLIRAGLKRILTLLSVTVFTTVAFFYDFSVPQHHGSVVSSIQSHPWLFIKYLLVYLGSPFYYAVGGGDAAKLISGASGFIFVALTLNIAFKVLWKNLRPSTNLSLLFFLLYVGGSAFATAGGRSIFGIDQALSSRYVTPVLMAWTSLFILYLPILEKFEKRTSIKTGVLFLLISCFISASQFSAFRQKNNTYFQKDIAGLALELGVRDDLQVKQIFHSPAYAYSVSDRLFEKNVSLFGTNKFQDLRNELGKKNQVYSKDEFSKCMGFVDEITPVESDKDFSLINGWIYDYNREIVPKRIEFRDQMGVAIGLAFTGLKRGDVEDLHGAAAAYSGFKGYVLRKKLIGTIQVISAETDCYFTFSQPRIWFELEDNADNLEPSIDKRAILENNGWDGSDYQRSSTKAHLVIGSYVNSDGDIGSISLKVKRGDFLHYRSGPTVGRQVLEIMSVSNSNTVLPVTEDWSIIKFTDPELPNEFKIKISDSGDGWGEWSAIKLNR